MNAKTKLAIWIGSKKKTYADGLAIYKELAINPKRNQFFDTPVPSTMLENMLTKELLRFARIKGIKATTESIVSKQIAEKDLALKKIKTKPIGKISKDEKIAEGLRVKIFRNPEVDYRELPEELKTVYDRFEGLYKSFDGKRLEIQDLPATADKNEDRKKLAEGIVALRKTIAANWFEIDTWWKNRNVEPASTGISEPSGKLTKAEIENIADAEIKTLSKKLRIEANLKYIGRNVKSEDEKTIAKLELRKKELDEWGVSYAKIVAKNS